MYLKSIASSLIFENTRFYLPKINKTRSINIKCNSHYKYSLTRWMKKKKKKILENNNYRVQLLETILNTSTYWLLITSR